MIYSLSYRRQSCFLSSHLFVSPLLLHPGMLTLVSCSFAILLLSTDNVLLTAFVPAGLGDLGVSVSSLCLLSLSLRSVPTFLQVFAGSCKLKPSWPLMNLSSLKC